jgi:hypothetical protein
MLAERFIQEQKLVAERESLGWTAWQMGDSLLLNRLQETKGEWERFLDDGKREAALKEFRDYAYQWY